MFAPLGCQSENIINITISPIFAKIPKIAFSHSIFSKTLKFASVEFDCLDSKRSLDSSSRNSHLFCLVSPFVFKMICAYLCMLLLKYNAGCGIHQMKDIGGTNRNYSICMRLELVRPVRRVVDSADSRRRFRRRMP